MGRLWKLTGERRVAVLGRDSRAKNRDAQDSILLSRWGKKGDQPSIKSYERGKNGGPKAENINKEKKRLLMRGMIIGSKEGRKGSKSSAGGVRHAESRPHSCSVKNRS